MDPAMSMIFFTVSHYFNQLRFMQCSKHIASQLVFNGWYDCCDPILQRRHFVAHINHKCLTIR